MSKGLPARTGQIIAIRPAVLPVGSIDRQEELFALQARVELPDVGNTADAWGRVEASDSHSYLVKTDDRGGPGIRASEWVATRLAEELNMACPTPKIIQLSDGQLGFGSRIIGGLADAAITTQILTSATIGTGTNNYPGLQALLSSLYAFDMFVNNVDRHDENYISIDDRGTRRFYIIDFGRSLFWNWPIASFPMASQPTRITFKKIVRRHGFDAGAAYAMLDRIANVRTSNVNAIVSAMPESWLDRATRDQFTVWWDNGGKLERIAALREGIADGSLI